MNNEAYFNVEGYYRYDDVLCKNVSIQIPIWLSWWGLAQHAGQLRRVKIKEVPVCADGSRSSQFDWCLEEHAEGPEQRAVGKAIALMWDFSVKHQRAFRPLRSLVCEAVTAIPTTGGAVAALLTVRVGVVVAAILDVSGTVNHDDTRWHVSTFYSFGQKNKLSVLILIWNSTVGIIFDGIL